MDGEYRKRSISGKKKNKPPNRTGELENRGAEKIRAIADHTLVLNGLKLIITTDAQTVFHYCYKIKQGQGRNMRRKSMKLMRENSHTENLPFRVM